MFFSSQLFLVVCSGLLSLCLTLALVPVVIATARRWGLYDQPEARKVHTIPVPRLGGLAVCIATMTGLALQQIFFSHTQPSSTGFTSSFIVPALLIFAVGFLDDLVSISAPIKLAAQATVGLLVFLSGVQVHSLVGLELPLLLNAALTIFWIVLITNAYNLVDGFDGVASGLGIIAAVGIGGTLLLRNMYLEAGFLLPIVGACAGFLRYNRSPASIFLGDGGSLFIGFTLAWISLATVAKGPALASVFVPFLALGVPFFDLALAVWRRTLRRFFYRILDRPLPVGIMTPDREHLHHRLDRSGQHPRNVAAILYLLNCFFVLVGIASVLYKEFAQGIFVVFFFVTTFLFVRYIAVVEMQESRIVLRYGFTQSMKIVKETIAFALLECLVLGIVLFVAIWGTYRWYIPSEAWFIKWGQEFPGWVLLTVTGTTGLRMYYYVRNVYAQAVRMLLADFIFLFVLLATVASVVTGGFAEERIQASYFFSLAGIALCVLRLARYSLYRP